MRALTYIEIDVPDFADSSPAVEQTFRFAAPSDYLPTDIEAIPSIDSVSYSPGVISLGENLGERASLTITLKDHRHIFANESFDSGSFWGKWRARYGTRLRGRSLRWIQGLLGEELASMETRHFVIESTDGPTPNGGYTIVAKDILKLADGDRALAPFPNNGFITGALTDSDTMATLSPSGIGNAEYPASGYVALGGEEIVSFTRSDDTLTITRGQLETEATDHDAGVRAQLCLQYSGEDPADIIYDLLVNYAGIDPSYIPLATWQTETAAFLQQVYSATIAEPTSVNTLCSELIEQAALALWWDPLLQLIRLRVLRAIPTDAATFTEDNTLEGSLQIAEQPDKRLSQVFTYFGQRNPLEQLDEPKNFRSTVLTIDADAEADYNGAAIKKIYSRWIPFGARTVAQRLNNILLGRFRDAPRRFALSVFRRGEITPELGGGYQLQAWPIQTITGEASSAPLQITRLNPTSDRFDIEAEEMLFETLDPGDLVNRVIILDADINNVNLRTIHDQIYPDPDAGTSPAQNLTVFIEENVIIGSSSPSSPAFDVGSWPVGFPISIIVRGRIEGAGGDGGDARHASDDNLSILSEAQDGENGGTAFYTRFPVDVDLTAGGEIWGGGGGGGGGGYTESDTGGANPRYFSGVGGGGGAGRVSGDAGLSYAEVTQAPEPGTTEEGGAGGESSDKLASGGDGGDPAHSGTDGFGNGGSAGNAIDGDSYITLSDSSPSGIVGSQVN